MEEAIQRFDGKNFEYINVGSMLTQGARPSNITDVMLLENGDISLTISKENSHFIIPKNSLFTKSISVSGKTIHGDHNVYSFVQKDNNYTISLHDLYSFGTKSKEILDLSFEPKKVIHHNNEAYYIQSINDDIYYIKEGEILHLETKGNIIKSNDNLYLWTNTAVYKLMGKTINHIADLPYPSTSLTRLKNDNSGNTIASYSENPNFQDRVYVLTSKESLVDFGSIIDFTRLFKDFWTDDAFNKWMLVGFTNIKIISLLRDGVTFVKKNTRAKKGSFGSIITGVASDNRGNIYFTKETEGYYKLEDNGKYTEAYDAKTLSNQLYNNGKLYYSSHDNYFYNYCFRYDGTTQLYKCRPHEDFVEGRTIPFKLNDFLVEGDNKVIVGGYPMGSSSGKLAIYDFKEKSIVEVDTYEKSNVRSIYYHPSTGQYWIGTQNGIHIYDGQWNKIETISARSSQEGKRYIESEDVIMINTFNSKLIVGTLGGIYIIDPYTHTVEKHIHRLNGLTNNMAIGIMPDNIGNCWISTFNGMNIMDSTFNISMHIYDYQGLPDREFNSKAIAKDENGYIYAGTINGLAIFDPQKVIQWEESYGLAIDEVVGHWGKSTESIDATGQEPFYNNFDSITISYSYPDYFKYPFSDRKIQVNSTIVTNENINEHNKEITLKRLPYGKSKINIYNPATKKTTALTFKATTDYSSLLFWLFIISFIILSSFLIVKYNKRKAEEQAQLKGKIAELQLTSLQSQMNPHFIFNALGAIQYFIQTHNSEKADEYLSNFAKLMRHILESSKSKYISIKQEIETLELYVGLEQVRFENIFTYEIIVDENLELDMNVPPMVLQPYVENAINHGLYNLKNKMGKLLLKFDQIDDDTIQVTIKDNGVGREKAAKLRTKRHKSRGMQIVNERVSTINNSTDLNLDIKVIDLLSGNESLGTEVIINIHEPG